MLPTLTIKIIILLATKMLNKKCNNFQQYSSVLKRRTGSAQVGCGIAVEIRMQENRFQSHGGMYG